MSDWRCPSENQDGPCVWQAGHGGDWHQDRYGGQWWTDERSARAGRGATMSDAARLVDELTTLLYEPLRGKCLTHTPCVIVACGACRKKADKPESVVHENDCPVYRLQRAEAANTVVIRANAEEIADLEDVRDALEAKVNALTAENARLERAARQSLDRLGRLLALTKTEQEVESRLRAALAEGA